MEKPSEFLMASGERKLLNQTMGWHFERGVSMMKWESKQEEIVDDQQIDDNEDDDYDNDDDDDDEFDFEMKSNPEQLHVLPSVVADTLVVTQSNQMMSELDTLDMDRGIEKPNEFLRFFLRMGFGALTHPYEYAKVLMQLGHEPLPAIAGRNWLGRSTIFLPSVHEYIRYIKHTDGIVGLYRGLLPRLLSNAASAMLSGSVVKLLGMGEREEEGVKQNEGDTVPNFFWNLLRDSIVITTGLGISHPFYVISVRQMAQFVGREVAYGGIWNSMREILRQDGIGGFYAGFVPRLLCDLGVLFATSTLSALCNRLFLLKSSQRDYNSALLQFGSIMVLYPLQVVGACMACSGSGLVAGAPPYMAIYGQWLDCLMDLYARGDHYRGAFIFRRTLPKMQKPPRCYDLFPISRMI